MDIKFIWSVFDQVIPVVLHIEVHPPEKHITPKNIGESLNGPQKKFWIEDLFVKHDKKKNINLI